eukprot:4698921-Pyramimonas_sp.AAC.2
MLYHSVPRVVAHTVQHTHTHTHTPVHVLDSGAEHRAPLWLPQGLFVLGVSLFALASSVTALATGGNTKLANGKSCCSYQRAPCCPLSHSLSLLASQPTLLSVAWSSNSFRRFVYQLI